MIFPPFNIEIMMFLVTIFVPDGPVSVLFSIYIRILKFFLSIFGPFQPGSIRDAICIIHLYFFISVIIPFLPALVKFTLHIILIFRIYISAGVVNSPIPVSPVLRNTCYFMHIASITPEKPSFCFCNTVRVIISPHSVHQFVFVVTFHLFISIVIIVHIHITCIGI